MYVIDIRRYEREGEDRKMAANEQCSSLGSMYMFIEFGRLGCKQIIYLGDVYVL